MSYDKCALIVGGVVQTIAMSGSAEWMAVHLGGTWIPVAQDAICGLGYLWDGKNFISPEPEIEEEE